MFKLNFSIFFILAILLMGTTINSEAIPAETQTKPATQKIVVNIDESAYEEVSALALVDNPQSYLNKDVKFKAKFDKFSALGLDYKPAFRDSKDYISFLIKKEGVEGFNIPLSELKILIKRNYAEQEMLDIESGDEIEIFANVFSTALSDPWIEVKKIKILTSKKKIENK